MRSFFLWGLLTLHIAAFDATELQQTTELKLNEPNNPSQREIFPSNPKLRRKALNKITRGSASFSKKLVQEVAQLDSKNFVISPLGVSLSLSMVSYGARKNCFLALETILRLPSSQNLGKIGFQALVDDLNDYPEVELHVANGVFVSSKIHPRPEFIEDTTKIFRSSVQKIDFDQSFDASNSINRWCQNKTHDFIRSVLNPDDVNVDTNLVLVSAVYFKGKWLKEFPVGSTSQLPFYVDDGTKKLLPTMSIEGMFRYGEYPEANAIFVELPYKQADEDHGMSMFVILPKEQNGIAKLEENFVNITVQELINRGKEQKVYIQLPKFKIESEIDLQDPLTRMDLGSLFDPQTANFEGIVESPQLVLTKIVQKAIVEINEEGCEAAAATAMGFSSRSFDDVPALFFANHPFYVIIATINKNPLNIFTARFSG